MPSLRISQERSLVYNRYEEYLGKKPIGSGIDVVKKYTKYGIT